MVTAAGADALGQRRGVDAVDQIRVLIAEDHDMLRSGLRQWLHDGGMLVVGEAIDGRGAVEQVAAHEPDVVLMDITMPGMDGLDALGEIHARFPDVRVVILSVHADEDRVLQAMRAGAAGYMLKNIDVNELQAAIRVVASGGLYLAEPVSKHVLEILRANRTPERRRPDDLSPRQLQVLRLIAHGRTGKAIALELGISAKTVETYRAQLVDRLGIHDTAGLVRYAVATGLVDAEP
jgi:DNA-binding NarL/FixJ family response regulator